MHLIIKSRGTGQAENAADGGARPCLFLQILDRNRCPICWGQPTLRVCPMAGRLNTRLDGLFVIKHDRAHEKILSTSDRGGLPFFSDLRAGPAGADGR
jgi:hypothetical protein